MGRIVKEQIKERPNCRKAIEEALKNPWFDLQIVATKGVPCVRFGKLPPLWARNFTELDTCVNGSTCPQALKMFNERMKG